MNLLEDEQPKQKKESTNKKLIKLSLIMSIIALVVVLVLMMFTDKLPSGSSNKGYEIWVNSVDSGVKTLPQVITEETSIEYVSIEAIAKKIEFNYFNGAYNAEPTEEKKDCYISNSNGDVIEFSIGIKTANKFNENSICEKQIFELENDVKLIENKIYVSISDLLKVACLYGQFNSKNGTLSINTSENLIEQQSQQLDQNTTTYRIDTSYENTKAILEGMMVISENSMYGVIDTNYNVIIGNKYKTMVYDEYTKNFIVSDSDGMYGVIDSDGNRIISLKYDKLYIVSYSPLLYAVMKDNKYGVIDKDEKIVVSIIYDRLACAGDVKKGLNQTFIIPNIEDEDSGMVVCKDNKYGIVNLNTKKIILECRADKINSKTNEDGTETYIAIANDEEIELQKYIETVNTITVIQN